MRTIMLLSALLATTAASAQDMPMTDRPPEPKWSLAIHGGAGTLTRDDMTPEREAEYRAALQAALDAGAKVLADGGEALDAVEAVILRLEDDEKFNAGRGAVFTWDETHELDASIMDGRDRSAGAIAGVTGIRHPILLARKVMEDSPHVMLAGRGAEEFAAENGIETMPPEWFDTAPRREALERVKTEQVSALDVDIKFGTVGAVALDRGGNLAAGTSTGGMTGKRWNRIGDSPVIGAGTYADNRSCAVSATGWGEYFIRVGVAKAICDRGLLAGENMQTASDTVMAEVKTLGGDGGVIVVASNGDAVFSFNTSGMYRGRATSGGTNEVAIYGEE
ncbi:isoaspartyl peptidase/L-asparaginase [Erythrobacter litoralis]|uniref:isoaspartyl peptidase/L-asparaginase family protein n=1 Tax=Erythrobacter litoralis TaxID=39960 RepID=UPI002435655C|nr:isoaspartyl peptidase/L-asparaginase [Erythrobacter litoralis]MDG6080206.1 isoaspartyl peptidase/L-asparaginase [Erythrobacter litoralis]